MSSSSVEFKGRRLPAEKVSNKRHRSHCSASRLNSLSKRLSRGLRVLQRSLSTRCISKARQGQGKSRESSWEELTKTHTDISRRQRKGSLGGRGAEWGPGPQPLQAPGGRVWMLSPVQSQHSLVLQPNSTAGSAAGTKQEGHCVTLRWNSDLQGHCCCFWGSTGRGQSQEGALSVLFCSLSKSSRHQPKGKDAAAQGLWFPSPLQVY